MNLFIPDKYQLDTYGPETEEFQKELFEAIWKEMRRLHIPGGYTLGVPDSGGEGGLCMHVEGNLWVVYISERGERFNPIFFASGLDAADYLVWSMCNSHFDDFPHVRDMNLFPKVPSIPEK